MNQESRICQNCKNQFTIEPEDFKFYDKIQVPPPTWCPECRMVRRFLWRNESVLYRRRCDGTGKDIFSMFSPAAPVKVYDRKYWWSDKWDAIAFGREYDFSRPFFEQFTELLHEVPWISRSAGDPLINSDYCMNCGNLKDCYLVFDATSNENCSYSSAIEQCKDCVDSSDLSACELCYGCVMSRKCYRTFFSIDCENSQEVWFSKNLRNCSFCFLCVNLRNQQYHILNKPYSKENYLTRIKELYNGLYYQVNELTKRLEELSSQFPQKYRHELKSINVSGDYLYHSKNVFNSYFIDHGEDLRYCQFIKTLPGAKDSYDYTIWGENAQRIYETYAGGSNISDLKFCAFVNTNVQRIEYSVMCYSSKDLFGCAGLKKNQYCILNKQYTKESFDNLKTKIIEHMDTMPYVDKKGRVYKYGEFFPIELSPFAYNETIAQEYFPLTEEQAIEKGYSWKEREVYQRATTLKHSQLPGHINDAPDSIINEIISCQHEGKCNDQCTTAFRIIPQELKFYRQMNLPLPRLCPNCRHYQRLKQRNPLRLWQRACRCGGAKSDNQVYQNTIEHFHKTSHCPNEFKTSYAPKRPEIVYCEKCYLQEVV